SQRKQRLTGEEDVRTNAVRHRSAGSAAGRSGRSVRRAPAGRADRAGAPGYVGDGRALPDVPRPCAARRGTGVRALAAEHLWPRGHVLSDRHDHLFGHVLRARTRRAIRTGRRDAIRRAVAHDWLGTARVGRVARLAPRAPSASRPVRPWLVPRSALNRAYGLVARAAASTLRLAGPLNTKLAQGVAARRNALARLEDWAREARDPDRPLIWLHAPSV